MFDLVVTKSGDHDIAMSQEIYNVNIRYAGFVIVMSITMSLYVINMYRMETEIQSTLAHIQFLTN